MSIICKRCGKERKEHYRSKCKGGLGFYDDRPEEWLCEKCGQIRRIYQRHNCKEVLIKEIKEEKIRNR